jgi:hypothetical protein
VVEHVAGQLGIPVASTNWRATLRDQRPDIVAVATPADSHAKIIEAALAQGWPLVEGPPGHFVACHLATSPAIRCAATGRSLAFRIA